MELNEIIRSEAVSTEEAVAKSGAWLQLYQSAGGPIKMSHTLGC